MSGDGARDTAGSRGQAPDDAGRLVFLDIDGTLIDSRQRMPDSARAACAAARDNGHRLFLCTGRSRPEVYPWLWDLGFSGIVGSGGAYGEIGGRPVFDHRAPSADVAAASAWLDGVGAAWVWQLPDGLWTSPTFMDAFSGPRGGADAEGVDGEWSPYLRLVAPSLHTGVPATASKCTFILPPASPVALDDVARRFLGRFHVIPGSLTMRQDQHAEMVPWGISKGTGLTEVAARLGVPLERTVAVGDSSNDVEMLRTAGVGIAMGNGRAAAKEAADRLTSGVNHDGLARAFAGLGLI